MKKFSIFALSLSFITALGFTSCTVDDDGRVLASGVTPGTGSGTGTTTTGGGSSYSEIKNSHSEIPAPAGGDSKIIVKKLQSGEVNYTIEFDTKLKATRWVAFQMTNSNVFGNVPRYSGGSGSDYSFDPDLSSSEYFTTDPFRNSGYSHGHLLASADRRANAEAQKQTFYLTNMAPQIQNNFNAEPGPWGLMETLVRDNFKKEIAVNSTDTMFVCRGATYGNGQILSNVNGMPIPKYFFSVQVLKYKLNGNWEYKALSFYMEHVAVNAKGKMKSYLKPIREIEGLTGIDFFTTMPKDIQDKVENMTVDQMAALWNIQ